MIIQCPSCGAQAKLPDSKEGAKVRCPDCEFVYVARPAGARGRGGSSSQSSARPIAIGAGVLLLVIVAFAIYRSGDDSSGLPATVTAPDEVSAAPPAPATGWDSAPVRFVRDLHEKAFAKDEFQLQSKLAEARLWAARTSTEERPVDALEFESLPSDERIGFMADVLAQMMSEDEENLVGMWKPFDGDVVEEADKSAVVRVTVEPRKGDTGGTRHVQWSLVKEGKDWKAASWERWYSQAELDAIERAGRKKKAGTKKTLSDGSVVLEAEPAPVPYSDDVSPETRARIDGLVAQLLDLELPGRELSRVKAEIQAFGKPAIPPLLTKLYELDHAGIGDQEERQIQAELVHAMLTDITGYATTFRANELLGGTTERRDSGVRQWFWWYYHRYERFDAQAQEEVDLLEEALQPRDERERRELERYKKLTEQEQKDG